MKFNFNQYAEQLARQLVAISHAPGRKRFFRAFGIEDLYNFQDKISRINSPVLIAVDGRETDTTAFSFDSLADSRSYTIIIAEPTFTTRPDSIDVAADHCYDLCLEVRNFMLCDEELRSRVSDFQTSGIGPIGDNFYGCALSFKMDESPYSFSIDPKKWKEAK